MALSGWAGGYVYGMLLTPILWDRAPERVMALKEY
jgi:hypothetical protein